MSPSPSQRVPATGRWTVVIAPELEVVQGGEDGWQAHAEGRVVYVSSLHVKEPNGDDTPADSLYRSAAKSLGTGGRKGRDVELAGERVKGKARIARSGDGWQLKGFMCGDGTLATCLIDFDDRRHEEWAIATWRSLDLDEAAASADVGWSPLEALAYLKPELPDDGADPAVELSEEDAPVTRSLAGGLLVTYLVDRGDHFSYVQGRHLHEAAIDADHLHRVALDNLSARAETKEVTVHKVGPAWALRFDGNFEASLILVDEMWDRDLRDYHAGQPVVALPSRDVLAFCDASSPAGVAELRAIVSRVWPGGDHLISNRLFRRRAGAWVPFDDFS